MTELRDFSEHQDALTVFFDYRDSDPDGNLEHLVRGYFDTTQILVLSGDESRKTGAELYAFIRSKVQNYEVNLPQGTRFVFCHYLPIHQLTEEWIDTWQKTASEFQSRLAVTEAFQQYHMIFLSYPSADTPLGEEKEETAKLMIRLTTEMLDIAHVTYMLYTNGFETMMRQEQGMARLIYLLSRSNSAQILMPMKERTRLKMLNYSDYSESRAAACSAKIDEIVTWMTEEKDPGQIYFLDEIKRPLLEPARLLKDAQMEFQIRVEIYPVHIEDFEKTGFFPNSPRVSVIGSDHAIIQKRKKEYFKDLQNKIQSGLSTSEILAFVDKSLYYKDLIGLKELLAIDAGRPGSLESNLADSLIDDNTGEAEKEIRKMVQTFCSRVRNKLEQKLQNLDEERAARQRERQRASKELEVAGRFRGIEDCFRRISSETSFSPIAGFIPEDQKTVCLIGSSCYSKWFHNQYEINEIDTAYYCAGIDPYDIAVENIGTLFDLNKEEAKDSLVRIL